MFPVKTLREFDLEQEVHRLKHELYIAGAMNDTRPKVGEPLELSHTHRMPEPLMLYLHSQCGIERTDIGWQMRAMSHNGKPDKQLHFQTFMDSEAIHKIPDEDLPYYLSKEYERCLGAMYDWLTKLRSR